ncbi:T9SS type A sorting domain-containing protein [Flavobacterium sp.]|uniref:T9SS type A sorting domain-containing protein n=1 Tax=Flavobacterium sp. TaxID=239 RepID=UPI0025D77F4A|nr:T9SS type A sorting domain-containing protein [Flavobacterium sp.]
MRITIQLHHKRIALQYVTAFLFCFLYSSSFAQIYSNGNLSTGTLSKSGVTSPTSYTWSELQNDTGNTTETNKSTGFAGYFNTAGTTSFQLGDDFIVPAGQQWNITSFDFFAHQNSFTGATIPVDQLRVQIWNGNPSLPGSGVIIGDMTNSILDAANSDNTFMYRIPNSIIGNPVIAPNTNRKIWRIRGTISATLSPGTYWVVSQFHATNDGSIFVPSVTVSGSRGQTGWNAKQNFVANTTPGTVLGWADIIDVGDPASAPDVAQDLPFAINGTITTLGTPENDFSSAVLIYPNPVKNSFTITMPAAAKIDSVEIYDLSGRKIKSIDKVDAVVNVSELSVGNYTLKVKSGSSITIKKFTKE